ncbi:MAG: hypothetical protein QOF83_866 [Solirubrobacteraceae bacterium]|nr:hypothetical protein [Solirubrobacteraceae bacterium]
MSAEHETPGSTRSGEEPDGSADAPLASPSEESSLEHPDAAAADSGATTDRGRDRGRGRGRDKAPNMLPGRERRRFGLERLLMRLIATCGIVGIGVAVAAIMVSSKSQGWIIGLVVSVVSVVLSAILWSSRSV